MTKFLSGPTGCATNPVAAFALLLGLAAGCAGIGASSKAAPSTVSDSDFGRLTMGQTKPADEARAQLSLARASWAGPSSRSSTPSMRASSLAPIRARPRPT